VYAQYPLHPVCVHKSLGLEALPPDSLVGLLGVSDCITLVDVAGESARYLNFAFVQIRAGVCKLE
jgi:hypothetical protein